MKKAERINQMLRYINKKQRFTLTDLINEFDISKRTALRDIEALEEMGVPLYAEYGRYGGYRLVRTMNLPPITFTSHEVFALYFAMQAIKSLARSPFRVTFQSISEKFLESVSPKQREQIDNIQNRLSFFHGNQTHEGHYLEEILMAAIEQKVIRIEYAGAKGPTSRSIQPIALYARKGYWYCQAYDVEKTAYRVFRCDRVISLKDANAEHGLDLKEITIHNAHSLWKPTDQAISFSCRITSEGAEKFKQENFPSMKITEREEELYLTGTYEPVEIDFIVSYLAGFGRSLSAIEPSSLKEELRRYYTELIRSLS
ncbi:helix-turn-helix transcriptional regulator [Fictibacillus enclensis]|uniref:helix-turn-helix transcriptional regulator n=1 Tax=Fictibacillus enclensis TaxID=1017270 RepID=UPI0024C0C41C|nr:YafY family protein [Fictibacillus enclensis]WHY72568.1 YafY family protein [Fictibacillus enclensis]